MATRLEDARTLLEAEREALLSQLATVEAALATLSNDQSASASRPRSRTEKPASSRPKRSRRQQTKWSKEELTCPACGFVAKAPQGLAGHIRNKHPEGIAVAAADAES